MICVYIAYFSLHFLGLSIYTYSSSGLESIDVRSPEAIAAVKAELQSDDWDGRDVTEKLDILQAVCDYECGYYLGCEPPKVISARTESAALHGSYNPSVNTITVSLERLENDGVEETLETLLHETRHAYQYAAVSAFNSIEAGLSEEAKSLSCFKTIEEYRESFDNYTSGGDDYYSYYSQEVEADSRSWAEWRIMSEYRYWMYPYTDQADLAEAEFSCE